MRRINVCQLSHLGGKDSWEKRKRSITEVGRWALDRARFCCAVEDATSFQEKPQTSFPHTSVRVVLFLCLFAFLGFLFVLFCPLFLSYLSEVAFE